ncbi:DEAD/DEAH box helicase [Candidatus Woesearchaeota archaeon]|nr:DEAD/DEAH box helicase [Candidatus Woesearchaeota archaeon]
MQLKQLKDYLPEKLFLGLKNQDIDKLRPCQEKAIRAGLLEGDNLLVCTPTGSGKTVVAEIAFVKSILETQEKSIYIVPLKSLALEKYKEFKEKYPGIKVGLSIGDLDQSNPWLSKYDLIITTSEKLDSLIRHGASWINNISVIIIDEIHLMNDAGRGPTLEILITLLRKILSNAQIIALSATIGNTKELAEWLDANLVEDDWRPVELHEGIFHSNEIDFFGYKENSKISGDISDSVLMLAKDTIKRGKQALIFCSSKKSAEATAEKISRLRAQNHEELSKQVLSVLARPTRQCKRLAKCIKGGVSFHHAGLMSKQKMLIENNFRSGVIKIICCTPTLAAGVNLPAFRAIMRSLKRYSGRWGSTYIPTLEYKQMTGRAGRPGMEKYGEAISIANSEDQKQEIYERYINGETEPITSKLAVEPILRSAILSLVASGFARAPETLINFFESSFYGHQYEQFYEIENKIMRILGKLKQYGFIKTKQDKIYATLLGKRISELYIDPESGHLIVKALTNAMKKKISDFSFLHLISSTGEVRSLRSRKSDWEMLQEKLVEYEDDFLTKIPKEWDIEYQQFLDDFKTALMLQDWIDEKPEEYILEQYRVRPGELYRRLVNSDWILYASHEIAKILDFKDIKSDINKARFRVKYGIGKELISLVKLKGIGRFRARKLYSNGIKNIKILKATKITDLVKLIGPKTAKKIREQLK